MISPISFNSLINNAFSVKEKALSMLFDAYAYTGASPLVAATALSYAAFYTIGRHLKPTPCQEKGQEKAPKEPAVFQEKVPVGLINQGNDCCFISALQLLYHTPSLKPLLTQSLNPLAKSYTQAEEGSTLDLDTNAFRQSVHIPGDPDHYAVQTDPMEYIRALADQAGLTLTLRNHNHSNGHKTKETESPVLGLAIPSQSSKLTLNNLLKLYFERNSASAAPVSKKLLSAPQDLVLCTQRFQAVRTLPFWQKLINSVLTFLGRPPKTMPQVTMKKVTAPIQTPLSLTLDKKWVEGRPQNYSCQGFVCHQGSSLNSGHYVAYIKVKESWWKCNDGQITQVDESQAEKSLQHSYIVSYRKI